jgi:hypothetical protein
MAEGFWKTALKVAGLAAIALFVLYKLYDRILGLGLLIGLSQLQSFIIVVLLAVLIFFVAIFSIWIWYLNNRNEAGQKSRLPEIHRRDMEIGIDFEIPPNCTFRTASTALASTDKSTINFSGFYKRELMPRSDHRNSPRIQQRLLLSESEILRVFRLGLTKSRKDKVVTS